MGLEYPYLAIVSFLLFAAMMLSLLGSQLWIQQQLARIPVLEGFASYSRVSEDLAVITVTVRMVRGEPALFRKILLKTEMGVVEVASNGARVGGSTLTLRFEGFAGTLRPGQECKIILEATNPSALFRSGVEYPIFIIFNYCSMHAVFMPP